MLCQAVEVREPRPTTPPPGHSDTKEHQMIRAISIAAVLLGLSFAAPVTHAGPFDNCPDWVCDGQGETVQTAKRSANGTQLTGIKLPRTVASEKRTKPQAATAPRIRLAGPPIYDLDEEAYSGSGGCTDADCPGNGTQLTGIKLPRTVASEKRTKPQAATLPRVRLAGPPIYDFGEEADAGCAGTWMCGTNGTQLTGIRLPVASEQR